MEAFPGQPTIRDLTDVYGYGEVGKATRFVGVTGDGDWPRLVTGLLNAAFARADLPHRALPIRVGDRKRFRKVAEAFRLQAVVLDESAYEGIREIARLDDSARAPVLAADGLAPADGEWVAYNALGPAAVAAVQGVQRERDAGATLKGRVVALAGCGPLTRMLAQPFKAAGASLLWASRDRAAAQAASQAFGGRQLLWEGVYATSHDVVVIGREGGKSDDEGELPLHPGYLKPGMTVVDLTAHGRPSPFLGEALVRGCAVVTPSRLLAEQVREHVRRLGADVPAAALVQKLAGWIPED
jgi:3-dehydroquinate dehydratase/shikimate dehydrogenase